MFEDYPKWKVVEKDDKYELQVPTQQFQKEITKAVEKLTEIIQEYKTDQILSCLSSEHLLLLKESIEKHLEMRNFLNYSGG